MSRIVIIILAGCLPFLVSAQFKDIKGKLNPVDKEALEITVPVQKQSLDLEKESSGSVLSTPKNGRFLIKESTNHPILERNENGLPSKILLPNIEFGKRSEMMSTMSSELEELSNELGESIDLENILLTKVREESDTEYHVSFKQLYKDVEVYYSDFTVHNFQKKSSFLTGVIMPNPRELSVSPTISEREALNIIEQIYPEGNDFSDRIIDFVPYKSQVKLVIYHHEGDPTKPYLSYAIDYYPDALHPKKVFINAHTGEIIHAFDNGCTFHNHDVSDNENKMVMDGPATTTGTDLSGQNRTVHSYQVNGRYYMVDASRSMFNASSSSLPNAPVGAIWTLDAFNTSPQNNNFDYDHFSNANNNWDAIAVSGHHNAGEAYQYFEDTHGRNSINGTGGNVVSFINVSDEFGNSMGNAFWNGVAMWYGSGDNAFRELARGLDVAGHEISHGVVQSTANLEYYGESGAMNESFADIFGAMIDRDDWKIGEDVVRTNVFPSGALRDMEDPHNGASNGDFGGGWQPKNTNEQYTGSQDNNGVHINSGIPNHAYYRYATQIGKAKAEKVFYRALTIYLTKSSKFVDLRNAVVQSAEDLYGAAEVTAAQDAFAAVGIGAGSGNDYEEDVAINPGEDLVLFTTQNREGLFIYDLTNVTQISNSVPISKPSVSDDGSEIVFIADDKQMHYIFIDWATGDVDESILQSDPVWRNVVISKDGQRLAGIFDELDNEVWVYDFTIGASNTYELYNPTFSEGVSTGDVQYADALEFDFSGEYVMYDALNEITGTSGTIDYWDVGFLRVWNNTADTWSLGDIQKLFTQLPEGVSIGNPTFSKNSDYIVAFDFIDGDGNYELLSSNIERGNTGTLIEADGLTYPSFSKTDEQVIFDFPERNSSGNLIGIDVGILDLNEDKISAVPNTAFLFREASRWGVWFSNGDRNIMTSTDNTVTDDVAKIYPTICSDQITIDLADDSIDYIEIVNNLGQKMYSSSSTWAASSQINTSSWGTGMYTVRLHAEGEIWVKQVLKP